MKKLVNFLMVAAIVLFAANCGGKSGSPSSISKSVYSQMQKGNYDKAVEILFENLDNDEETTSEENAQYVAAFSKKAKESVEAEGGVKSFEIVKEEIAEDGATATVEVKITFGDGSEETQTDKFVKRDGVWKYSVGK